MSVIITGAALVKVHTIKHDLYYIYPILFPECCNVLLGSPKVKIKSFIMAGEVMILDTV